MTRSSQKKNEHFLVVEAAKLLGKEWRLGPDRENPDFIVTENAKRFGLEVVEIFTGPQDGHGAGMKKTESDTQKAVNALRDEYEAKDCTPLRVKLVGDMCDENVAAVVPALEAMNLSAKPLGHQECIKVDEGKANLSVYATRALRADWLCENDRVGPVDHKPMDKIEKAIKDKAANLQRYKKCSGLDDIRLLIFANRIKNSGKLRLKECPAFDLQGFQAVYFFSYPESVKIVGVSDI